MESIDCAMALGFSSVISNLSEICNYKPMEILQYDWYTARVWISKAGFM